MAAVRESAIAGIISALATVLVWSFLAGGTTARTQTRLDDQERRIELLERSATAIQSIDRRLSRIEGHLGIPEGR